MEELTGSAARRGATAAHTDPPSDECPGESVTLAEPELSSAHSTLIQTFHLMDAGSLRVWPWFLCPRHRLYFPLVFRKGGFQNSESKLQFCVGLTPVCVRVCNVGILKSTLMQCFSPPWQVSAKEITEHSECQWKGINQQLWPLKQIYVIDGWM